MINKFAQKTVLLALAAGLGLGATLSQAQERVYSIDQRGAVAKSGFGLCWRTGYWTPAAAAKDPAGCECDKDLLPKEVCEPQAAAPAVPVTPVAPVTPKPAGEKITLAADALFDFDKAVLRTEGKSKLDDVAAKAKDMKLEVILAVGHTDRSARTPTTRSCPRSAPPPSRSTWFPRASKPTASTPKARARSSP